MLTERKFFGAYYHSLVCHSQDQYRLFSGRSINTEKEEATFHHLKTSTNLTSNHKPRHVIRIQERNRMNEHSNRKESELHTLYKPIK